MVKGKLFCDLICIYVHNTQKKEIYVLKDIYLYLYKKIYSLRKLVVVFTSVISGKIH